MNFYNVYDIIWELVKIKYIKSFVLLKPRKEDKMIIQAL